MFTDILLKLAGEIGPRPIGTPANARAAAALRAELAALGLVVEEQALAVPAWQDWGTLLEAAGERLEAITNPFSPRGEVTAPMVSAGTLAELAALDLTGRIVLLYGALALGPLAPKSWFLKSAAEDALITRLETSGARAVLLAQTGWNRAERLIEDAEFQLPSATMPPAAARRLLLLPPETPVHLRIASYTAPGQALNLIGRWRPETAARVVLCAHFDTKFGTPGALDNAAGVASVLETARRLIAADFPLGLDVILFNGEEYLPVGSFAYVDREAAHLGTILAVVNFDGVGALLGATSIASYAVSPAFQRVAEAQAARSPAVVWVEPWPESDHSTFVMRGVPALAFTSRLGIHRHHSAGDSLDWVDAARLEAAVDLATRIVGELADKTPAWTRPAE
jgi:aminopeptidase YwaD